MKIYVGHSGSFDFKRELYEPLRGGNLSEKHEIVLPHEFSDKPFNSEVLTDRFVAYSDGKDLVTKIEKILSEFFVGL